MQVKAEGERSGGYEVPVLFAEGNRNMNLINLTYPVRAEVKSCQGGAAVRTPMTEECGAGPSDWKSPIRVHTPEA